MKIFFRTDASMNIGSGHVMRCLTLAEELKKQDTYVTFICRELPGNMNSFIEKKGYNIFRLPLGKKQKRIANSQNLPECRNWLGTDWEEDALQTKEVLKAETDGIDWLIVDHYSLDYRWECQLRPFVSKIMVIDDLADRRHECDILLDQNYYVEFADRYKALVNNNCVKLLGAKYTILRQEFRTARANLKKRNGTIQRIIIFFGAVDPTNETEKALKAIRMLERLDIDIDVVVGEANPHKNKIQTICESFPHYHFHCQINNMAELMAKADLAIGAGGTMTWERCYLGLPAVVISIANNQWQLSKDCAKAGVQIYLGKATSIQIANIHAAICTFLLSPTLHQHFSQQAMSLVDGLGTYRVVSYLMTPSINLRTANPNDCKALYIWRNAKETRKYIFNKTYIPFKNHQRWFKNSLQNPNRILLIGEYGEKPLGVLRYDLNEQNAIISIYLVPENPFKGVGAQLIREGSYWLRQNRPEVKRIYAEILFQNIASQKAFSTAGYSIDHLTYYIDLW